MLCHTHDVNVKAKTCTSPKSVKGSSLPFKSGWSSTPEKKVTPRKVCLFHSKSFLHVMAWYVFMVNFSSGCKLRRPVRQVFAIVINFRSFTHCWEEGFVLSFFATACGRSGGEGVREGGDLSSASSGVKSTRFAECRTFNRCSATCCLKSSKGVSLSHQLP